MGGAGCQVLAVFEIKVLLCAPAGCKDPKMVHLVICSCVTYCVNMFKSVHPAAKVCIPGAGCTLDFEHSSNAKHQWRGDSLLLRLDFALR